MCQYWHIAHKPHKSNYVRNSKYEQKYDKKYVDNDIIQGKIKQKHDKMCIECLNLSSEMSYIHKYAYNE